MHIRVLLIVKEGAINIHPGKGSINDEQQANQEIQVPYVRTSQVVLVVKNPPANVGDVRDTDLIPGWGRSPGEGNGNPLQYSCLENPMDRGYSPWGCEESDMIERLTKT